MSSLKSRITELEWEVERMNEELAHALLMVECATMPWKALEPMFKLKTAAPLIPMSESQLRSFLNKKSHIYKPIYKRERIGRVLKRWRLLPLTHIKQIRAKVLFGEGLEAFL